MLDKPTYLYLCRSEEIKSESMKMKKMKIGKNTEKQVSKTAKVCMSSCCEIIFQVLFT